MKNVILVVLIGLIAHFAQGTEVCGDVSGIWDISGSPYVVNCEVTVPAGETLEIQAGVEVLFTGHYKLNVFGNLQAIGTEQDSIVFTRAFPTEESKWWGIRLLNSQDTSRIAYCELSYGHATAVSFEDYDDEGGAVYVQGCRAEISHSSFHENSVLDAGGAIFLRQVPYGYVGHCVFENNHADDWGGGGGAGAIEIILSNNVLIDHSVFVGNSTATNGGALVFDACGPTVSYCTFFGNSAVSGSSVYGWLPQGFPQVKNSILWDSAGDAVNSNAMPISVTYSDIYGYYPGVGNINTNPLFEDALNGSFFLQPNSPCINTGDPTSPLDPDGSRADMGAFPFSRSPVCGNVNGTWPAYSMIKVECDLTVPDGDTLVIEPGVTVEFLGDYKMTVNGTLLAEGANTDRIEFWTDTTLNPNRWSGVRFIKSNGSSLLENCVFRFGSCIAGDSSVLGGAVFVDSSVVRIEDCLFDHNQAQFGGAVNMFMPLAGSTIRGCVFRQNESVPFGATGYGGAVRVRALPLSIEDCLFEAISGRLGAAVNATLTDVIVQNCTFVNNSASVGGHTGNVVQGSLNFVNCIFVGRDSVSAFDISTGNVDVEFSCIDGWAGPYSNLAEPVGFGNLSTVNFNGDSVDAYGNIFVDPLFGIDEFDLMWNSQAIDAGNPASPLDPDSSIADQGWKPYYQPNLFVEPDSLWFDTLVYGESQTLYLTVTNPSPAAAPIISLTWNETAFDVDSFPNWILPGDTIVLAVEFIPPMEGIYYDTLRILSKLAGQNVIEIPLHACVPLIPSPVDSLVITRGALNGTMLYWAPVTSTTSGQPFSPDFYIIWGATSSDGPYVPFGVSATTSYQHPFIINTQDRYFYIVTANDGSAASAMESQFSNPASNRQRESRCSWYKNLSEDNTNGDSLNEQ